MAEGGNGTSFSYDLPGRLTSVFYPSNPTNAFVTNTYDSLGRVAVQSDANGNVSNLYFAGSRTEIDDPAGTPQITYFRVVRMNGTGKCHKRLSQNLRHLRRQTWESLDHIFQYVTISKSHVRNSFAFAV